LNKIHATAVTLAVTAMLGACSSDRAPVEPARTVRTAEIRYDAAHEVHRYAGTVQSRYEVDQAFRVSGKVVQRKVDVGQTVREGDVLAVLDDKDYRLAEGAARQQWHAAVTQARQAESDRQRLNDLKSDGSVSAADDERAHSAAQTAQAAAEAQERQLELATNRLSYTVLRASRSGVVTAVRLEVGQMVAEGQPVVAIADPAAAEIVVDVPEDRLVSFKKAKFHATLASAPEERLEVTLRELSPQAAAQTRTYRARLRPVTPHVLPLGSTTLVAARQASEAQVAAIPATALTQANGKPALWAVKPAGNEAVSTVELVGVEVHGYRNEEVLVSGVPAGVTVVTAGVQKMAPGLKVAPQTATPALAEANDMKQQVTR
jgi:membrane fusion protein, multidrug efflux system